MKKTSFDVELSDKPGRDGLHRVRVRIYQPGEMTARTTSAIAVNQRDWNPKKRPGLWVRSSNPRHARINEDIEKFLDSVREQVEAWQRENPAITPRQCSDRFRALAKLPAEQRQQGGPAVVQAMRDITNDRKKKGLISVFTRDSRLVHILRFEDFLKTRAEGAHLTQAQLNPNLLNDFQDFLSANNTAISVNTVISGLRSAWHDVLASQGHSRKGLLAISPFSLVDDLKVETNPIQRLGDDELAKLHMNPWVLMQGRRGQWPIYRSWAKWCYLACYFQAGMRVGDLIRSRYSWYECGPDGKPVRLAYQMMKSGHWIRIPLSKQAQDHLMVIWRADHQPGDYLLPFLDSKAPYASYHTREEIRKMPEAVGKSMVASIRNRISYLNAELRKIGWEELGLPKTVRLKMHSARHSLADKLRIRMKTDKRIGPTDARDLLGHSAFSVTEKYFEKLDQESLDGAANAIYE